MSVGRLTTALVTIAVFAACSSDSTGPADATGTYNLVRINGMLLPVAAFQEEDDDIICVGAVTSGSLALTAQDTFQAALNADVECTDKATGAQEEFTEVLDATGTYTRTGNNFVFFDDDGDDFTGVLAGSTLTVNVVADGLPLVLEFVRQ